MTPETQVILLDIAEPRHSTNGGNFYRATWLEPESNEIFKTDIDSTMGNFKRWAPLIRSNRYHGLYTGLKIAQNKHGVDITIEDFRVISGDSQPHLFHYLTIPQIYDIVENYQEIKPKSTFDKIYEIIG